MRRTHTTHGRVRGTCAPTFRIQQPSQLPRRDARGSGGRTRSKRRGARRRGDIRPRAQERAWAGGHQDGEISSAVAILICHPPRGGAGGPVLGRGWRAPHSKPRTEASEAGDTAEKRVRAGDGRVKHDEYHSSTGVVRVRVRRDAAVCVGIELWEPRPFPRRTRANRNETGTPMRYISFERAAVASGLIVSPI